MDQDDEFEISQNDNKEGDADNLDVDQKED